MDPARSSAARDRAERAVFEALPELDALPRRALALATLAGVPRAGIASEIGLAGPELSTALATARKALRRTRAELSSGGRCERAERALSDRLDGAPHALQERFLDAHLGRCERCRAHERELEAAVAALRAEFDKPAEPVAPEEPPTVEPAPPRARLRVVPPTPLLPPAPEPPALDPPQEPAAIEPPATVGTVPSVAPANLGTVPSVAPATVGTVPSVAQPAVVRHQRIRAALPVAVAVLIAVGLVAAAIALLSAFGTDPTARAPWDGPDAPVVHPAPISGQ